MLIIINPAAGGGTALERWRRIESQVKEAAPAAEVFVAESAAATSRRVARALAEGCTRFVAGGGDGTVNTVLGGLIESAPESELHRISLGAIGLGSSNDFHKPFRRMIDGVPCRLDFDAAAPQDIGALSFIDPEGHEGTRYWLVNASIGTTADANHFFNHPDRVLEALKRKSVSSGILYAAARTFLRHRCREMTLTLDDALQTTSLTRNIGIIKNPHFAGNLRYDNPYEPDSGEFFVHQLEGVSLPRLAFTFAGLARGRFTGQKGTRSWKAHRLSVQNCGPFAVEYDGEVTMVRRATFSLIRGELRVCP
jgi:diacylglycerol kinase family enzyme